MEKVFVSWSGGKDCCQAAYLASKRGFEIKYLFNMINPEVERSCSHGISTEWIELQSRALSIPIIQEPTRGDDYEQVFVSVLKELKEKGVTVGIFGDIDFMPHLEWIEKVCCQAGISPVLPLWGGNQSKIASDFIDSGFKSIVIATRADLLGEEWLGKSIDHEFLNNLAESGKDITPCGEAGEFHSLVIDGPLFNQRIEIVEANNVLRGDHWFLDIKKCKLREKK